MLTRYRRMQTLDRPGRRFVWLALVLFGLGMPVLTGCTLARSLMAYSAPKTEKVAAEFSRLQDKNVLVFVWAQPETLWNYPKVRLDVASYVSAYLKNNVENVTLVDPIQVESYLEKRTDITKDPAEVGRHFQADMVVHLAVYKFTMRDPGLSQFHRGRISSSVVVYDLSGEQDSPERVPLADVAVVVPEKGPVGFTNAQPQQVRQATYDAFAVAVGKKFHGYERPLD